MENKVLDFCVFTLYFKEHNHSFSSFCLMPSPQPTQTQSIHVSNLNPNVKEADLRALFEKYGPVKSVKLLLDPEGCSRGCGFVEMEKGAALEALLDLNKAPYCGQVLDLTT